MSEQTVQRTDEELPQPAEDTPPQGSNGKPRLDSDDYTGNYHVYEPFHAGLPPMRPYLRELWRRRQFALQLSKTKLRAKHYDTTLGQLWLIITPLLMACVYFLLVMVIRGGSRGADFFAHLVAALFLFHLFSQSVQQGANSIVGGGKLILNTAFPRILLPISSVVWAFRRFLPTVPIAAAIHVIIGVPFGWETLFVIPIVGVTLLIATGVSCLVAALQVYFRDLSNFLPHVLRIWLYTTPILYTADQATDRGLGVFMWLNPMAPIIRSLSATVDHHELPDATVFFAGLAWAVGLFLVGVVFFISRERELAVRL
jgi:ABC-type polysaccharide/polyol phosphate export permease